MTVDDLLEFKDVEVNKEISARPGFINPGAQKRKAEADRILQLLVDTQKSFVEGHPNNQARWEKRTKSMHRWTCSFKIYYFLYYCMNGMHHVN